AAVHQRGDLGVGIDANEAAAELVAVTDADQPGIVFRPRMPLSQELFEQDRDLDPIGRPLGIELQRMAPDRQLAFMRRPRDGAIDAGELAAAGLLPGPDLGRLVFGRLTHAAYSTEPAADALRPDRTHDKKGYGNSIRRACEMIARTLDGCPVRPYDEPDP